MDECQPKLDSGYISNSFFCPGRKGALFVALLAVALLYAVVHFRLQHTWATNDDVGLSLICSGTGFASAPDPHLMFTNIIIGCGLARLYEMDRHIPWYGCYMVLVNLIGIIALAYSLLYGRLISLGLFALGVSFCLVGLPNLCAMQFTTDSCILAIGGFGLILTWWESKLRGVSDSTSLISGTCLLVFASLVRYQSFLMVFLLAVIFFVIRLLPHAKAMATTQHLANLKLVALSFTTAFVVATAFYQANIWAYSQAPGWGEFYKANALTANFADFSFGIDCPPERKALAERKAGWSDNDLSMLQSFFFFDSNLFSVEKMEIASNLLRGSRQLSIANIFSELRLDFESLPMRPFVYCGLFFTLFYRSNLFNRRQVFALCVAILVLDIVMLTAFKLAPHVYKAIATFFVFIQLFYFNRSECFGKMKCSWQTLLSLVCAVSFIIAMGSQSYTDCRRLCRKAILHNLEFKRSLEVLHPTDQMIFVIWREFFPFEYILPFDDLYSSFEHFNMFPFTLRANSALAEAISKKHNINLQNFAQRLSENNVYLFSSPALNPLLEIYLAEHYQVKRRAIPVRSMQSSAFKLFMLR